MRGLLLTFWFARNLKKKNNLCVYRGRNFRWWVYSWLSVWIHHSMKVILSHSGGLISGNLCMASLETRLSPLILAVALPNRYILLKLQGREPGFEPSLWPSVCPSSSIEGWIGEIGDCCEVVLRFEASFVNAVYPTLTLYHMAVY